MRPLSIDGAYVGAYVSDAAYVCATANANANANVNANAIVLASAYADA